MREDGGRAQQQLDFGREEGVRVDCHAVRSSELTQDSTEGRPVDVIDEERLVTMALQHDMVRQSGNDEAWKPRHWPMAAATQTSPTANSRRCSRIA